MGDSGNCNVNVNCTEGQNWQKEKDAVARIYVKTPSRSGWCSGALVNNTRNNLDPLFLTANHCLADVFDAVGNSALSDWIFYWHYEHPTCSNSSNEPPIYSTVGATVKANNSASDFALLELTQDPRNLSNFTPYYLGWDRSGNAGSGGIGIHHPKGDVKKISTYSSTPTSTSYGGNTQNNTATHWRVQRVNTVTNHSVTEGGSSGSPLLNSSKRVIGQLHGGYSSCNNNTAPDWYGKFSTSWTGNNNPNNNRRLSSWLDPAGTNQTTLDGIGGSHLSGPSLVCSQATYTLKNLPTGATVRWSASNSNLSLLSGQGTSRAVFQKNGNGSTEVNATVNINNQSIALKKENIWVGLPRAYTVGFEPTVCVGVLPYENYNLPVSPGAERYYIYTNSPSLYVETMGSNKGVIIVAQTKGTYETILRTVNKCGHSETFAYITAIGCVSSGGAFYSVYPNPTTSDISIEIHKPQNEKENTKGLKQTESQTPYELQLWNATTMLKRLKTTEKTTQMHLGNLPKGIYFLHLIKNGKVHKQMIILK